MRFLPSRPLATLAALWLALLTGFGAAAQHRPASAPADAALLPAGQPLADALTSAGTLRPGATGSFDATGYRMGTDPTLAVTPRFSIYPNPAPAAAPLRLTGGPAHQPLMLLDLTGRGGATLPTDADGAATLPAGVLAPGLYVVQAADGRTARLVVQ